MHDPKRITRALLHWYKYNGRSLPWRRTRDPYAIWVSEIMLQQTRVDTVIPYYLHFLSRFPTVRALADAPLSDVLKTWENMGYYSRARNLHKAARVVTEEMGGGIPDDYEELVRLPGIGAYTASAILSFAFGKRFLAADANVLRVLCRLFALDTHVHDAGTLERIRKLGGRLMPRDSSSFNQSLMDLGAMICASRNPKCDVCPVSEYCLACARNIQEALPRKKKRSPVPYKEFTAAVIRDGKRRVLVVRRPAAGLLGGLWKFPGGEKSAAETLTEAVAEAVHSELGIRIEVGKELGVVKHAFTHFHMSLHVFECSKSGGRPRARGCGAWRWADVRTIRSLPFAKADRKIVETLIHSIPGP